MNKKIIVALNHEDHFWNLETIDILDELVDFYKIGIQTPHKDDTLDYLKTKKKKIFLDYKYYDISSTVQNAVKLAEEYEADFLTVHTDCIHAAMNIRQHIKILEVYSLTEQPSYRGPTFISDGIIVDAIGASYYKEKYPNLICVTPGIRLPEHNKDEHLIANIPAEAKYSDYIVIGRPITNSTDPRETYLRYEASLLS